LAAALQGGLKNYDGSIALRLYNADGAFAEHSINNLAQRTIMDNITLVSANSPLFKGTVRENLLIAQPAASDDALWEVLSKVKLDEFLRSEQGLDTSVVEGASNLSGGQRQRLALARALLHNTPLYIFDEATSNIDAQSEEHIMAVIKELAVEKAVLLISHRLANVTNAQIIYVMDEGKVVEQGRHDELLATESYYASLYWTQHQLETFAQPTASTADRVGVATHV
jgi:ABC-type transport system involved in cytochrome bd biosynthesis fused ATPase/permease subunit